MARVLQLRVTSPPSDTDAVVALLDDCEGVSDLAVFENASRRPVGDLVIAGVVRESVDEMLTALRDLGIEEDGAIALITIDTALSKVAEEAKDAAPGEGADAVIWEEVVRRTDDDSTLSRTFVMFLALATILAGIAVINDSPVLVIGAMVVGPEFGPLAALAVGLVHKRFGLLRKALVTLAVGFGVAMVVTTVLALLGSAFGWIDASALQGERPLTGFIWHPDKWSFIVAFVAGIAGVLSLTSAKSGALTGVFISVTTVPAAGNFAVALALGDGSELAGSAAQLGVNLFAIVVAGVLTLLVHKGVQRSAGRMRETG